MERKYILGIDQSTQGTKALLFNQSGDLICRTDLPHEQIIDERGYVEHNPMEIYENTIQTVKNLVEKSQILKDEIVAVGISNQRETALAWDRKTGIPVYHAIVWQCARGESICNSIETAGYKEFIGAHTGLQLSPYFSAAKISWILENVPDAREKAEQGNLNCGTMDSWLVYKLTGGREFRTDYSNASRTQLFNINTLSWDKEICNIFSIPANCLAQVTDSDGLFGVTDFDGFLDTPIPIHAVLGDSHGALFGQGCHKKGMTKATYGTGSSVMMNIGSSPVFSFGVVTSLAWKIGGEVNYVLEGNVNYTGAVISWLKNDLKLIESAEETQALASSANPEDKTYLVPAFTGVGAPYWDSKATASITGITRLTTRSEIVRAALDCIAYQIADILAIMTKDSGLSLEELRVDGGPTRNAYLMQFQSDMVNTPVLIPEHEELSGIGAAYVAGLALGIYEREELFKRISRAKFTPNMSSKRRDILYSGWRAAVESVLTG